MIVEQMRSPRKDRNASLMSFIHQRDFSNRSKLAQQIEQSIRLRNEKVFMLLTIEYYNRFGDVYFVPPHSISFVPHDFRDVC